MRTKANEQTKNDLSSFKISGAHLGKVLVGIERGYIPSIEYVDRALGDIHIFGNAGNGFKLHVRPYGHKSAEVEKQRLESEAALACAERRALEVRLEEVRAGYSNAKAGNYTQAMNEQLALIKEIEDKLNQTVKQIDELEQAIKTIHDELTVGKYATMRYELDVDALKELKVEVPVHGAL